jgi:hypothetical protein
MEAVWDFCERGFHFYLLPTIRICGDVHIIPVFIRIPTILALILLVILMDSPTMEM